MTITRPLVQMKIPPLPQAAGETAVESAGRPVAPLPLPPLPRLPSGRLKKLPKDVFEPFQLFLTPLLI